MIGRNRHAGWMNQASENGLRKGILICSGVHVKSDGRVDEGKTESGNFDDFQQGDGVGRQGECAKERAVVYRNDFRCLAVFQGGP